jgi:hypothetical protein
MASVGTLAAATVLWHRALMAARQGNAEAAGAWMLCAQLVRAVAAEQPADGDAAATGRRVLEGAKRGGLSRSALYAGMRDAAQLRYLQLKASNPRRSDSALSRQIARELGANASTVRTSWLKPVRSVGGTSRPLVATVPATDPRIEHRSGQPAASLLAKAPSS